MKYTKEKKLASEECAEVREERLIERLIENIASLALEPKPGKQIDAFRTELGHIFELSTKEDVIFVSSTIAALLKTRKERTGSREFDEWFQALKEVASKQVSESGWLDEVYITQFENQNTEQSYENSTLSKLMSFAIGFLALLRQAKIYAGREFAKAFMFPDFKEFVDRLTRLPADKAHRGLVTLVADLALEKAAHKSDPEYCSLIDEMLKIVEDKTEKWHLKREKR